MVFDPSEFEAPRFNCTINQVEKLGVYLINLTDPIVFSLM